MIVPHTPNNNTFVRSIVRNKQKTVRNRVSSSPFRFLALTLLLVLGANLITTSSAASFSPKVKAASLVAKKDINSLPLR